MWAASAETSLKGSWPINFSWGPDRPRPPCNPPGWRMTLQICWRRVEDVTMWPAPTPDESISNEGWSCPADLGLKLFSQPKLLAHQFQFNTAVVYQCSQFLVSHGVTLYPSNNCEQLWQILKGAGIKQVFQYICDKSAIITNPFRIYETHL